MDFCVFCTQAPFLFRTAADLWAKGWSPFTAAKYGPGRLLVSKYVDARYRDASWQVPYSRAASRTGSHWTSPQAKDAMKAYLYHNWTEGEQSGGGYAHATLLLPGAYARSPLCKRIPQLKVRADETQATGSHLDSRSEALLWLWDARWGGFRASTARTTGWTGEHIPIDAPACHHEHGRRHAQDVRDSLREPGRAQPMMEVHTHVAAHLLEHACDAAEPLWLLRCCEWLMLATTSVPRTSACA